MFLKRERPERDDFVIQKKYLAVKKKFKYFKKLKKRNLLHILAFRTLYNFSFFPDKNLHFLSGRGFIPLTPPLGGHVRYEGKFFFGQLPLIVSTLCKGNLVKL